MGLAKHDRFNPSAAKGVCIQGTVRRTRCRLYRTGLQLGIIHIHTVAGLFETSFLGANVLMLGIGCFKNAANRFRRKQLALFGDHF